MEDEIAKIVIGNVDRLVETKGIGRNGLAELLGVSPPAVTIMLKSSKPMKTDSIGKLAKALGVDFSELFRADYGGGGTAPSSATQNSSR